jgi:ribose 5-phosphate isomerase B
MLYAGSLYIASDHGGYRLKKRLVRYIENELKLKIKDMGPFEYRKDDDYPDYAVPLSKKVVKEKARGILVCSSGIGMCITANKIKGVKAGLGHNIAIAESMMKHDNTNILCLGAKMTGEEHAMAIVKKWLMTKFSNAARHKRRLKKIMVI